MASCEPVATACTGPDGERIAADAAAIIGNHDGGMLGTAAAVRRAHDTEARARVRAAIKRARAASNASRKYKRAATRGLAKQCTGRSETATTAPAFRRPGR